MDHDYEATHICKIVYPLAYLFNWRLELLWEEGGQCECGRRISDLVQRCSLSDAEEPHVNPGEVEAAYQTEVNLYFKQEGEKPAEKHISQRKLLEGHSEVVSDERYEGIELAFWIGLTAAHQHDQDQMVDGAVWCRHVALVDLLCFA